MLAGVMYMGAGVVSAMYALMPRPLSSTTSEAPLRAADTSWVTGTIIMGGIIGPALGCLGALLVVGACLPWGFHNNLTRKISAPDL
jgi:hypothetical protein